MPFHDLNVIYATDREILQHTLSFHHELGYNTVALAVPLAGKLPQVLPKISVSELQIPTKLKVLTRLTLTISDNAQNHRIPALHSAYDLLALRPMTEKTLQLCCSGIDCDIISLDLSQRLPFILKFTTMASALQRGIRFEICYSPGISGGNDARRNLISGAASLIRATRGRGIIISSEARTVLGVRAPWDAINLAQVWGLSQERGKEAVCEEAEKVIKLAALKRNSYRGVVSIPPRDIEDGIARNRETNENEAPSYGTAVTKIPTGDMSQPQKNENNTNGTKRKVSLASIIPAQSSGNDDEKPLSKREIKRRTKKARRGERSSTTNIENVKSGFPIKHETLNPS